MVGSSHTANSKIRVVVMILFGTIEIWGIFVLPRSNINNRHVHTMYGVPQVTVGVDFSRSEVLAVDTTLKIGKRTVRANLYL